MTLHTVPDPEGIEQPPKPGADETPLSYAMRTIGNLLMESPLAHQQFQDARHDRAVADRLHVETVRAGKEAAEANARLVAERHKANPHKRINRTLGTCLAASLALLDAVPAYWTAEAFGLDQNATLIVTVLLCVALGGAMWLLDLFAGKGQRLAVRILGSALGAGFVALFLLRFSYLQVVGGEDGWSAGGQAFALTGLSAALVVVGFVLLSHRVPKPVADAEHHARRAARHGARAAADAADARAAMSRAALEDTVITWALSGEPAEIGHEQLIQALGEAVGILLTR
jgi:hypothetical protein